MNASSLTDLAYQGILALIEKNRLAPDDRLPGETTLAELIGVSRPVIRQALARLRAEGWVISRKGSGNFLGRPQLHSVPFDPIRNVDEVRAFLEYTSSPIRLSRMITGIRKGTPMRMVQF